jgi:hypothetical protein
MWDFPYYDQETLIRALEARSKIYLSCGIVGVRDMGVDMTVITEKVTFAR